MSVDADLDRVALGEGPTPVRELTELGSEHGQAAVWLKDDGSFSPYGGNKTRKLEWILGDARRRGKRTILTGGALGTNHGLACALSARTIGIQTALVLVPQPDSEHVRRQLERIRESGADLHLAGGRARAYCLATSLMLRKASAPFNLPYFLPPGGSTPIGCVGYVDAALELAEQIRAGDLPEPSHVVVAIGTGGTAAGLMLGMKLAGLRSRLVGVLVNDLTKVDSRTIARLSRRTQRLLAKRGDSLPTAEVSDTDIEVDRDWLGSGYGHSTPEAERAIALLREREQLALEPVYTAKAMAALMEQNRRGHFGDGPVLYWHTYRASEAQ